MTGRDLIIYILDHHLEDKELFQDDRFIGFISDKEFAAKYDVGVETVKVWYDFGLLKGVKVGESLYFPKDAVDPRKE